MNLHPVEETALRPEILRLFQSRTPLLTAGDAASCNTMTVGWGQLGTLWNRPVCTVYVRPERYTFGFMEQQDLFTLSFLPEDSRSILSLCGSKSGRDTDKIRACGLHVCYSREGAPFFREAELVLVCRKLYVQDLEAPCVRDHGAVDAFYGEKGNWHRAYTGEVTEVYAAG